MREFKDCTVQNGHIKLNKDLTPERFHMFIKDLYSGQIPIFKLIAVLDNNSSLQTVQGADHQAPDPISILEMMDRYCPACESSQPGEYSIDGDAVHNLDKNIKEHNEFLNRVSIKHRNSPASTCLIFNKGISQKDICQVHYFTREFDESDFFPEIETLHGDMQMIATAHWTQGRYSAQGNDGQGNHKVVRNHIKSFHSNDFYQWGYNSYKEKKAPRMRSLVNLELPMLYTNVTSHSYKVATPVFLCYRGCGIMTNADVRKRLFKDGLDFTKFYFPPKVRFALQDYIGVTQRYTPNNIPYINIRDIVDEEVLQGILNYYGNIE